MNHPATRLIPAHQPLVDMAQREINDPHPLRPMLRASPRCMRRLIKPAAPAAA